MDFSKINSLLDELVKIQPDDPKFEIVRVGGPVEMSLIEQVQADIGFPLCRDYVQFLETYGNIWASGFQLYGIEALEEFRGGGEDFRTQGRLLEEHWELSLLNHTVLQNEDDEWYIVLDHVGFGVYSYDPFAKEFALRYENLEEAITVCLKEAISLESF